jgi:hypothetical protein
MTDAIADAIAEAQLLALVDKLKKKTERAYAEQHARCCHRKCGSSSEFAAAKPRSSRPAKK